MRSIGLILFGTSWKVSLLGYIGMIAIELSTLFMEQPEPGWHIVAVIVGMIGRMAKDASVTGGTVPATPEATKRVVPTATKDGGYVDPKPE